MNILCKFLSLDVNEEMAHLFSASCKPDDANASRSCEDYSKEPVECLSYTIRHKYPKRLVTYDAEERCEPRKIRAPDLEESHDPKGKKCENPTETKPGSTKAKATKVASKCSKLFDLQQRPTKQHLKIMERRAKTLYQLRALRRRQCGECTNTEPSWESLSSAERLSFCWRSLTHHELRPTPYENFRQLFIARHLDTCPQLNARKVSAMVRPTWLSMKSEQRVPFNLHALLYHVSTGDLDPFDHCAVRVLLNRWR
ncbi:uncharacterized protein LOC6575153 [Drosophila mojavensis]|uniref:Uncharacterized protein n=1 Tax=Drosophila mojavensis TaxID=7230 RepID=B4K9H0_DROMO|nr:uncharacterized protein LOC6575153 [Drosophila mojavensis]EDW16630.2 uncharacterized protein Dmoj_GI10634 [Drosophila mojavensis]